MKINIFDRPEPPAKNLSRVGSQTFNVHVKSGWRILGVLEKEINEHYGEINSSTKILDFGCGVGRVSIPIIQKYNTQLYCTDVDHTAIEFMTTNFGDKCTPKTNNYLPPLPFEDNFFDIIFSISIWSHLQPEIQIPWLKEMDRIMRENALLLISTAGFDTLEKHNIEGRFLNVSAEMLHNQGIAFVKNTGLEKNPNMFPGVTGDWGVTFLDPEYVQAHWSKVFKLRKIINAAIGKQDLIVMEKYS